MDIKDPIENKYMKCVLQINGFSDPRPRVQSNHRVGSGGATIPGLKALTKRECRLGLVHQLKAHEGTCHNT